MQDNQLQLINSSLTLTSMEVAEMVEKNHAHLMRDIKGYMGIFVKSKIGFNSYFQESTYKDGLGRDKKCYEVTEKGCELIAHKLTGEKGVLFTAKYIDKFHEMKEITYSLPVQY